MKITGKDSISNYIKLFLQGVFIFGSIVVIVLPWAVDYYFKIRGNSYDFYWSFLIMLYISGIPMLTIVFQFIKLFDSLKRETPFIEENAKYLKVSSICSGIIALEYVVGIFVFKSVFTLIITGIFLVAWLGLYIVSELFKQAVQFKEENELTI